MSACTVYLCLFKSTNLFCALQSVCYMCGTVGNSEMVVFAGQ